MIAGQNKRFTKFLPLIFLVLYLASPLFLGEYLLFVLLVTTIMVIVAQGLNIMVGFTLLISFGQPGFMVFGAYFGAILATKFAWIPFPVILLLSGVLAALLGTIIGFPCLRLSGFYLALATFGFSATVYEVINYLKPLTGGNEGMYAPAPSIGGISLTSTRAIFYIAAVCMILTIIAVRHLSKTRTGRAWYAIRDDQTAASSMGINLRREKLKAFAFSAFLAGVAGVLYSYAIRYLETGYFSQMGLSLFLILVAGGIGTVYGPVYGSVFMTILPQLLGGRFSQHMSLVYGVILVLFILLAPNGIHGLGTKIARAVPRGLNAQDAIQQIFTGRGLKDKEEEENGETVPGLEGGVDINNE